MATISLTPAISEDLEYIAVPYDEDPGVVYSRWAAELGVLDTGTDANLDGDDSVFSFNTGSAFFDGISTVTTGMFSSEGGIGISKDEPTSTTRSANFSLNGVSRMYTFSDRPDFLYTLHPEVDCESKNVKLRTSNGVTIMTGTIQRLNIPAANSVDFAIKFEANKITSVVKSIEKSTSHYLNIFDTENVFVRQALMLYQDQGDMHRIVITRLTYSIDITVSEDTAVSEFLVIVRDAETLSVLSQTEITVIDNTPHTINLSAFDGEVFVEVMVKAKKWAANRDQVVGDIIYPDDSTLVPHYFKCIQAGKASGSEPGFNSTLGSTYNDGTVIWENIESLIKPEVNGPLKTVSS